MALPRDLQQQRLDIPELDLGGGLGIVYNNEQDICLKSYATLIRDIIHPLNTDIIIEPGRLLVGNAGLLLSRVTYIKENEGRYYMILDGGMNDLMRPALYDAFHPIRHIDHRTGAIRKYDIVGPVCETGDTFSRDRPIPESRPGDLITIMASGAYGFVMASDYNTRPKPPEILVHGDNHAIIRPRDDIHAIIEKDTVPDWIS